MGGLNRHWAQILLFVGALTVVLPFLHLGTPARQPERRPTIEKLALKVEPAVEATRADLADLPDLAALRVLVSD